MNNNDKDSKRKTYFLIDTLVSTNNISVKEYYKIK